VYKIEIHVNLLIFLLPYKYKFCFNLANEKGLELMLSHYPRYFAKLCLLTSFLSFSEIKADDQVARCEEMHYTTAIERFLNQSRTLKISEMEIGVKESELYQVGQCHNRG
jgi:hypothetical protein